MDDLIGFVMSSTKPKPSIPPKPSFDEDEEGTPAGKVKKIVDSLSQSQVSAANGGPEPKGIKKAPTVKPKPRSKISAAKAEDAEQAPPLPEKQSRRLQWANTAPKNSVGVKGNDLSIEGGRSGKVGF